MRAMVWLLVLCGTAALTMFAAPSIASTFDLRADTLTANAATQTVIARGHVRVTDGLFVASAGRAEYAIRARRLILADTVVVRSPEGTIRAHEVTLYFSDERRVNFIVAAGNVWVETRGRTLKAQRITYEPPTGVARATGSVAMFAPPEFRATGEDLIGNLRREAATLTGRARVQTAEGFVEGDRLDVDGRAQTAVLRDHVNGGFRKIRLTADTATVRFRDQKAVFRGHVKLVDPSRTLIADQVTVYYNEGRMVAEGATSVRVEEDRP
jgi:lipopolysaccharide export system protein LptA